MRREFDFPSDALIVSTIGALHPRKSHELFIEAAVTISAAEPRARFLVIGEGELLAELQDLVRRQTNGLDDRLAFTGVRDDIPRLLSATDVYVKPGVVEGFVGITVLEALALGKPVVAFETEDVKLALTDGETGLIVPNGDVASLAEKILYLLEIRRWAVDSARPASNSCWSGSTSACWPGGSKSSISGCSNAPPRSPPESRSRT